MRSRERKLELFLELLHPGPDSSVVDVGVTNASFGDGSTDNFFEALYPWPARVTAVGHDLPFADRAFDLGFSNAVVEHVGGREEQRRFVHELCRVAERVFVTTPNRFFPLEVHSLVPFAHWLPRARRDRVLRARGFDDILEPLGPKEL